MFRPDMKFIALLVPEITWVPKNDSPCIRPRSLCYKISIGLLFGRTPLASGHILKSVALPVPEIIAIGVLGGGCKRDLREGELIRGLGWYRSKER